MQSENKDINAAGDNYRLVFWCLLVSTVIFKLWYATKVPLASDEAYHWQWARHLDWCYSDHPPMVGWLIFATTSVFGHSLFGVRIGAVFCNAGIIICVALLVKEMFGSWRKSMWTAVVMLVVPIFAVGSIIINSDTPFAFFWTLSILLLWRALQKPDGKLKEWILIGVAMGGAFLSKLLAFIILPAVGTFLLLSPSHRRWIFKKEPYVAIFVSIIVFSPVIFWNMTHDWANFLSNVQGRHDFGGSNLHLRYLGEYVGGQMLVFSPLFFLSLFAVVPWLIKKARTENDSRCLYLLLNGLALIVFFLFVSFFARVGAHWTATSYIVLSAAVVLYFLEKRTRLRRTYFLVSLASCFLLIVFVHASALYPSALAGMLPDRMTRADSSEKLHELLITNIYGWEEWGERTAEVAGSYDGKLFIAAGGYDLASLATFYTPGHPDVHCFDEIGAVGENYKYWDDWDSLIGWDGLFLYDKVPGERMESFLTGSFESVDELPRLEITRNGRVVRIFHYFLGRTFLGKRF